MISQRAQSAFKRGQEWERQENLSKAINAYREAVAIVPDWVEPHQHIGALHLKQGQYDEAAAAYRQAKPLAPDGDGSIDDHLYVIAQIQEGALDPAAYDCYVRARDIPDEQLDEKMALCQQALGLNATYAAPYAVLGKVLLAKGHPNQARAVLERGLSCDPPPFTRANLLFALGNVLLVSGQRDAALAAFGQVVELNANPSVTRFATMQLEAADAGRI
jgi:tetratricopeptide (TPR) repeat protein